MMISFPIQGYGPVSIFFSSLHICLSYVFVFYVYKDVVSTRQKSIPILFLKTALIFLVLSTFGTWVLAPLMISSQASSALYYGAIQFFLHFQFNGWFIFAALALLFKILDDKEILYSTDQAKKLFWILTISCILTFALAITWSNPNAYIFMINSLGVLIQVIALIYLLGTIKRIKKAFRSNVHGFTYFLLSLGLYSIVLKIVIQTCVAIPLIAKISYTVRNFLIGFIHLLMLGALSTFLLALINYYLHLPNKIGKQGIYIFVTGFILSEVFLALQGLMFWAAIGFIPYYYEILFAVSMLMPVGIIIYYWDFNLKSQIQSPVEKQFFRSNS